MPTRLYFVQVTVHHCSSQACCHNYVSVACRTAKVTPVTTQSTAEKLHLVSVICKKSASWSALEQLTAVSLCVILCPPTPSISVAPSRLVSSSRNPKIMKHVTPHPSLPTSPLPPLPPVIPVCTHGQCCRL